MNTAEYANLAALEREHWYYSGKRRIAAEWLERARPVQAGDLLLDCGAGTGLFAEEMARRCRVLVLDDHPPALALLRQRFPEKQILALSGDRVPLPEGSLDFVTALDVLEHVKDDQAVVDEFHRLLKPGGVALVTVPAAMSLWSDWDVALHHHRRYDRRQLRGRFDARRWELVHVNYTNVAVFPLVWLVRKWRTLRRRLGAGAGLRNEDVMPPRGLNRVLRGVFVVMGRSRIPFPFGVSLVLVARRR